MSDLDLPIDEDWLKASGFRWSQLARQPEQHWLLWLGSATNESAGTGTICMEDIGIELAPGCRDDRWFCWFRADTAGTYSRFVHVRYMRTRLDVVRLVEAITGFPWTPERHIAGVCRGPKAHAHVQEWLSRADVALTVGGYPWHDIERDPHMAGAHVGTLKELVDRQKGKPL